jgi:large subunit ribosomal protein L24
MQKKNTKIMVNKLRKGDTVIVIAGKDKNKIGTIERVMPSENRVVVKGVNMVKKTLKRSSKNPSGGIIDLTAPIHASNVMLLDPNTNKPARVGYKMTGDEKVRVSKISGEAIKGVK